VPTPREQRGRLSEASRLLQEGLQLLDERSREVDALVEQAEERARRVTAHAQVRAQEITAAAERQRAELEEQVAELRSEIAAMREELASLKAPPPTPPQRSTRGAGSRAAAVLGVPAAVAGTEALDTEALEMDSSEDAAAAELAATGEAEAAAAAASGESRPSLDSDGPHESLAADDADEPDASDGATVEPPAIVQPDHIDEDDGHTSDAGVTPRWGRRSSMAAGQQAVRTRSARPRWLPPWIPFLLMLLAAAPLPKW
jgi:hypothetical protein